MTQNKLQLNSEKTEATRYRSTYLDDITIPLFVSIKSHGVLLDSVENFISQTSKSCYYQLRRINSTRKYLSTKATVKLVTSFILSRLDYCNTLLSGLPVPLPVHSLRLTELCCSPPTDKNIKLTTLLLFFNLSTATQSSKE